MRLRIGLANGARLFLLAAVLLFFAYVSYQNLVRLSEIQSVQAAVQKDIDAEKKETEALEAEQAYQESDEYYEKVAREQLGLIRPDEILFIPR